MARRSAKKSIKRSGTQRQQDRRDMPENVRVLFEDGWSPIDGNAPTEGPRDQSFRKTIRPQNETQAELFEQIDQHNVVFACGPAGTGKTYVAVAKAVEALEA
ncbi:MAG: PhoH family protein, partial [Parvularculaceae bacterium]|nr:PhoH family protein [Parvularculaceae bacterium]